MLESLVRDYRELLTLLLSASFIVSFDLYAFFLNYIMLSAFFKLSFR